VSGSGRRWGWHALADDWADRIVEQSLVHPSDLVLDIGAGLGSLTAPLLATGARVIAVEMHPGRAARLYDRLAPRYGSQLTVLCIDARELRLPHRPFRVVANPPYGLSSALLTMLLSPRSRLVRADLVLQRAVARKYAEGMAPGSRRWLRGFELTAGVSLPRTAFRPPPRVDSAVLTIRRH
jgi:23S rRNA (adenine-N6)-dimethyltransferase